MNCEPAYVRNSERFENFYALQRALTGHLARHPSLVAHWLGSQSFRDEDSAPSAGPPKAWRTSRLNLARRRELKALGTVKVVRPCGIGEPTLVSDLPRRIDLAEVDRPGCGLCRRADHHPLQPRDADASAGAERIL